MARKKVAVLVIAAVNLPVYISYIRNYWASAIRYTNQTMPDLDIFLLLENHVPHTEFREFSDNLIVDPTTDYDKLCPAKYRWKGMPGIMSKTLYAFEQLADHYDAFFRTNLSSMIRFTAFDGFVQNNENLTYSGAWAWTDTLRDHLVQVGTIGPERSIKNPSELSTYPGNTFISGAGYFVSKQEAKHLASNKAEFRYDLPDDVAVGLMMKHHDVLRGFAEVIPNNLTGPQVAQRVRDSKMTHIRLSKFEPLLAEHLWHLIKDQPEIWH